MTTERFLHLTAPKNPDISDIPHGLAQIFERANKEAYDLLAFAYKLIKSIEQPDDLPSNHKLVPWPDTPYHLEVRGSVLHDIRCRGLSVGENLQPAVWVSAHEWLGEHNAPGTSESRSRLIARMDAADERAERAA